MFCSDVPFLCMYYIEKFSTEKINIHSRKGITPYLIGRHRRWKIRG